jgi:hypothetical protein
VAGAYEKNLRVPLNFFIITQISIHKDSLNLTSWIQEDQIRKYVLPEINRIWMPANIEFYARMILIRPALAPNNKHEITEYLAKAKEDHDANSDPERIAMLSQLISFEEETSRTLNIYLVPYLGQATKGHAIRKERRAFIAQWTDKIRNEQSSPERFNLIEKGNFIEGSIARTIAHEIGHLFKLTHPELESQTVFNRLMGGNKPGYDLTADEISLARKYARKLIN